MEPEEVDGQGTETGEETEIVAPEETQGGEESKLNPAWSGLLEKVPSQLHSQVTPYLEEWDKNYQRDVQKVHSQYEPLKPYLDRKPEEIDYALQLMQAIETDPAHVAKALAEYAGISLAEAKEVVAEQGQQNNETDDELMSNPRFKEMYDMTQAMAQLLVQQQKTAQEEQMDKELDNELKTLKDEHGEFDVDWVLTKALANPDVPLETHVKAFHEFEKSVLEKNARKPGPKVLKPGGSAPDNQTDVSKLSPSDRRALIAQQLQQVANQSH